MSELAAPGETPVYPLEDSLRDNQGVRGNADAQEGQFKLWIEAVGGGTEASFINQLFGVYA